MRYLAALLLPPLLVAAVAPQDYRLDVRRYFSDAGTEASSRSTLTERVNAYLRTSPPASGSGLAGWLDAGDDLRASIQRHDIYVYLRAEENVDDAIDARADDALTALEERLEDGTQAAIASFGAQRLAAMTATSPSLARYRYLLAQSLAQASHRLSTGESRAVAQTVEPALAAATASYKALRRSVLASPAPATQTGDARRNAFDARWAPFERHEDAFAAQLLSMVPLRNGVARLEGFDGAPAAAYSAQSLTTASVMRTLAAIRSSGAFRAYCDVLVSIAARRLGVAPKAVRVWDRDAVNAFVPPDLPFDEARKKILAAERPMGAAYASAYERLLDPANRRIELCVDPACDATGFSVGFAGSESGVYFGGYRGAINDVRAVAHESGHAVHRQFMNESQSIAAYNEGPHFMFESFAIFNELLFYDREYESAGGAEERAYYLNRFLDDATFQVFGSAEETDLEARIYADADAGKLKTAEDLNALTAEVFARYDPLLSAEPAARVYWARDSLYFTDPLYNVSYLYAGLLALKYFDEFERRRSAFSEKYVALLRNGFNDSPAVLERKFLGIDLGNEAALVEDASDLIGRRTQALAALSAVSGK